jgi:hypothetical protein
MSIYGIQKTTLGFNGCPAKREGALTLTLMLNLTFTKQLAGTLDAAFCDPNVVTPAQFAQGDDQGIRLIINVVDSSLTPVDLRAASSKTVVIKNPDLTTYTVSAEFLTNGADGKVYVVLTPTALEDYGFYFAQFNFVLAAQSKSTRIAEFQVMENLPWPV